MHLEGAAVATEAFAERLRVSKCFLPLGGCKNHFNICPTTCEEKKVDSFTYLTQVIHERPQLIHIYIVFFSSILWGVRIIRSVEVSPAHDRHLHLSTLT
jgi:hypothetical protein